jgi:transcriptional regulator with XRE-family HTH domain
MTEKVHPMPNDDNEDRLARYLDQYLSYRDGNGAPPDVGDLSNADQQELSVLFRIIDANWSADMDLPPLEDDPVAQALGLVLTQETDRVTVAGSSIKARRQALGLSRSDLAAAVTRAGWNASAQDVALLERSDAEVLLSSQALALAHALKADIESLAHAPGDPLGEFVVWLHSAEFDQIVSRWATRAGRDPQAAAVEARSKMLAPARRSGGGGGKTQWLQTLQAILEAMA